MSLALKFWQKTHRFFITGSIMACGDCVSQLAIEKRPKFDWERTGRFALLGVCFVGPVLFNWYRVLDRIIIGQSGIAPLKKLCIDQMFMAPIVSFSIVSFVEAMQGSNFQQIKHKLVNNLPSIVANQYKIWPMAQLLNFYFIPLNYRLLYVNIVAFFWNIYLSYAIQVKKDAT